MKRITYHIDGHEVCITLSGTEARVSEVVVDGQMPTVSPADMPAYVAAASLALLQYEVEEVHDEEADVLTIGRKKSPWSNPTELMQALPEVSDALTNAQLPTGDVI
ncbi:MAG: hypothetical protein IJ553_05655 [Alloprevotella sp.]|nr:hypothetical protein [Alloprevotella sp.]